MYAEVVVAGASILGSKGSRAAPCRTLVTCTVVYLENPKEPGKFIEREVRLGQTSGEQVEALSGVQSGDVVVTEGSFFVRAERERLGLRPARNTESVAHPHQQAANAGGSRRRRQKCW